MSKWTDAELTALASTAHLSGLDGYRAYKSLVPDTGKGFDGWEVKRRRIPSEVTARIIERAQGQLGPVGDFVGLSMAYFDIETTFSNEPIMLYGAIADVFGNVTQFRKGDDITDDSDLVRRYAGALEQYDVLVSWNGKLFDVPVIQSRLGFHDLPVLRPQMHIDLMYYATGQFNRLGRKSLQNVSEYFEVSNRKTPLRIRQWNGAMAGKEDNYEAIVEHCDADVLVLRDVFPHLKRHIRTVHRAG